MTEPKFPELPSTAAEALVALLSALDRFQLLRTAPDDVLLAAGHARSRLMIDKLGTVIEGLEQSVDVAATEHISVGGYANNLQRKEDFLAGAHYAYAIMRKEMAAATERINAALPEVKRQCRIHEHGLSPTWCTTHNRDCRYCLEELQGIHDHNT